MGGRGKRVKLLIVMVQDQDANRLLEKLIEGEYRTTKLASTGGFLRAGNTTLLIGVEDHQVEDVVAIIKSECQTREKTVTPILPLGGAVDSYVPFPLEIVIGGAIIFVVDVEQFLQI